MDTYKPGDVKIKDDVFETGKEFAFEGLTEEYFKANSQSELERFRLGYQAGLAMQPEASFPTEEFKNKGKR